MAGFASSLVCGALARRARSVELGGAHEAAAAWELLGRRYPGRRLFVYYWTEAGLPLMLYGFDPNGLVGRDLVFVHDDTLGGRLTRAAVRGLGRTPWRLRHGRAGSMARDLGALIRDPRPVAIAVDGRGPYGRVGPEFPRLLTRVEGVAVPLAVDVESVLRVRWSGPVQIPRPGARLRLVVGGPVDARIEDGDLRARLQRGLDEACAPGTLTKGAPRVATAGA